MKTKILANIGEGINIVVTNVGRGVEIGVNKLIKKLYSDKPFYYKPELKIVSDDCTKIVNYCFDKEKDLTKPVDSSIKPINTFSQLGGKFLEKIMGYTKI